MKKSDFGATSLDVMRGGWGRNPIKHLFVIVVIGMSSNALAAVITVEPDALTINGIASGGSLNGTTFSAQVAAGKAHFSFRGDLDLSGDTVNFVGARPADFLVANNANLSGAIFNATPGTLGGGAGAGNVNGGVGGVGAARGGGYPIGHYLNGGGGIGGHEDFSSQTYIDPTPGRDGAFGREDKKNGPSAGSADGGDGFNNSGLSSKSRVNPFTGDWK